MKKAQMFLTIIMRVAGPMKLQMKYVSNRSQHLETERGKSKKWGIEISCMGRKTEE